MQDDNDNLADLLSLWADYMRRDDHALGYKRKAAGLHADGLKDSEQLYDREDQIRAEAVQAAVDSLLPSERAAIYKRQGLAQVWRFEQLDMAMVMLRALDKLREILSKKGLIVGKDSGNLTRNGASRVYTVRKFAH